MIPRAIILQQTNTVSSEKIDNGLNIDWFDYHPGDRIEEKIRSYLVQNNHDEIRDLIFFEGYVIYIQWWKEKNFGISIVLGSKADNFFNIGMDAYNWVNFISQYYQSKPHTTEELETLFNQDFGQEEIQELPKVIQRPWFDISLQGGKILIKRQGDYNLEIANLFGFFPWITYFGKQGEITKDLFSVHIEINETPDLNLDRLFQHVNGELDEQFWSLIYQFVRDMDQINSNEREKIWFQFLVAADRFTTNDLPYKQKMSFVLQYKDILTYFNIDFLNSFTRELIQEISQKEPSKQICMLLLRFSELLLELEFTDLCKLAEGTALDHALQLPEEIKKEIIIELTVKSTKWGEKHLIGFIQSLTGLLSNNTKSKEILSEVINQVHDDLKNSWDGMLCIVDGKLIADKIADAISLRFQATKLIPDKTTRGEDIYASIIWSLDLDYPRNKLFEIAKEHLEYATDIFLPNEILEQSDILTQKCLLREEYEFLQLYLKYLREHLDQFLEYKNDLITTLDHLLTSKRSYPMVYIEFLLIQLYSLAYNETEISDQTFQLVGRIFNSINPSLSDSEQTLAYISSHIIDFGVKIGDFSVIEETERRFLLLKNDEESVNNHLKSIFLRNAINRSKLPSSKLETNDIGLQLFNRALKLSKIDEDYELLVKIIPLMKKLAIKSRSYSEFADLMLLNVRMLKITGENWLSQFFEDIKKLVGRDKLEDIKRIFNEILHQLDLTIAEEIEIMKYQLKLVQTEPDLLTADEIYAKRLKLIESGEIDSDEQQEFMIDNFQQGISELLAKGDTYNLTNILFEAINYALSTDASEVEEFVEILFDNFEILIEDFKNSMSSENYQYILTIWRRLLNDFKDLNLDIIIKFSEKLFSLNISIYLTSRNRQYLRRSQLIVRELAYLIGESNLVLNKMEVDELYKIFNKMYEEIITLRDDYGIFLALNQMAIVFNNLGSSLQFFTLLDMGISNLKKEIVRDEMAYSATFLIILEICELANKFGIENQEIFLEEFRTRLHNIIDFALSLKLDRMTRNEMRILQDKLNDSILDFIRDYPLSLNNILTDRV